MDIEISPGAALERSLAQPRNDWGLGSGVQAGCDGWMIGKRVCSVRHSAPLRGKRHLIEEQMKGILWHHSSFNLVEPWSFAPAAA